MRLSSKRLGFKIVRMTIRIFVLTPFIVLLVSGAVFGASTTMRLDYYHTGTASQETFSVDRIVIEPLPWPGNPKKNIDETNLGKYMFEVRDRATNRLFFSPLCFSITSATYTGKNRQKSPKIWQPWQLRGNQQKGPTPSQ